jgi:hypothetical protein
MSGSADCRPFCDYRNVTDGPEIEQEEHNEIRQMAWTINTVNLKDARRDPEFVQQTNVTHGQKIEQEEHNETWQIIAEPKFKDVHHEPELTQQTVTGCHSACRQTDAEHELILDYIHRMTATIQPMICTDTSRAQLDAQEYALLLQASIMQLQKKISQITKKLQLQEEIQQLEQSITSEQQKRTALTQARDDILSFIKENETSSGMYSRITCISDDDVRPY